MVPGRPDCAPRAPRGGPYGQDRRHRIRLTRRGHGRPGRVGGLQARRLDLRDRPRRGGDTFKLEETMATDALLLGRVTYEGFAEAWPSRDGEFADKFNSMPKYVVSSTLERPEWSNSTRARGRPCDRRREAEGAVRRGRRRSRQRALVQALIEDDLVDELRLMVFPVVLGSGKRLFGETADKEAAPARRHEDGRRRRAHPHVRTAHRRDCLELRGPARGGPPLAGCRGGHSSPLRATSTVALGASGREDPRTWRRSRDAVPPRPRAALAT